MAIRTYPPDEVEKILITSGFFKTEITEMDERKWLTPTGKTIFVSETGLSQTGLNNVFADARKLDIDLRPPPFYPFSL